MRDEHAPSVELFGPDDTRGIHQIASVDLGSHPVRTLPIAKDEGPVVAPVRYAFRSFDRQWIIPDHRLVSRARPKLWALASPKQIFLTALEAHSPTVGPAVTLTSFVPDQHHYHDYKGSFGGRVYPLWADAHAIQSNVRATVLQTLATALGSRHPGRCDGLYRRGHGASGLHRSVQGRSRAARLALAAHGGQSFIRRSRRARTRGGLAALLRRALRRRGRRPAKRAAAPAGERKAIHSRRGRPPRRPCAAARYNGIRRSQGAARHRQGLCRQCHAGDAELWGFRQDCA